MTFICTWSYTEELHWSDTYMFLELYWKQLNVNCGAIYVNGNYNGGW